MAAILPFRALRYDPGKVKLADVVTQPYDKITPAMQEAYYARSPFNLVRVILGRPETGDRPGNNVYTRAAAYFAAWRAEGVLRSDTVPCIYPYSQEFLAPGEDRKRTRKGFIALGKLYEYGEGVVFRHEQTLSGPKADRLKLLRATRAHFGQIFMLYSDAAGRITSLLESAAGELAGDVEDEYATRHRLRAVSNGEAVAEVQRFMAEKQLIIADGHHRYETALEFRRQDPACGFAMMTFIPLEDEGLVILPTHRVVKMPGFDAARLKKRAAEWFEIEALPDAKTAMQRLRERVGTTLFMVTPDEYLLLTARPDTIGRELVQLSSRQRSLDVVVLHQLLLQGALGMSEASIRNQEHISYVREAEEAIARVRHGAADCAFLMSGVRPGQVREIAMAGEMMPQKSTDFYPKLLSGLAMYALD